MTNLTIFKNPNAVAVALPPSKMGTQIASGMGGYNRIATNTNGTFKRIINGEQVGKAIRGEFNAIILAMLDKPSRSFYAKDYDPDAKGSAPDCFSNQGSGKLGKGKACRFSRKVALFLDGDDSGDVYQFNIPAKSLFGKTTGNTLPFEQYCRHLVSNQAAPDRVVTTVAYNLDAETMELTFTADRFIDLDELARVNEAQNNPATTRLISFDVVKTEAAAPADEPEEEPVKLVTKSSPKKPSFMDDDGEEDEEEVSPEPVKRASKKSTAATPTGKLANVVSEWGDEDEEEDD